MKIPPKKPHFFKPILPGFSDGMKIPVSFFKYLGGKRYHQAVLRRGVKEWRVRINDQCLREGWSSFSMENNLEVGDFVVFKHEGNMVFEVLVFDPTHCEREHPTSDDLSNADPKEAKENPSKKIKSEEHEDIPGSKNEILRNNREEGTSNQVVYPYFYSTMKPGKLAYEGLNIPTKFAKANGLDSRKSEIILRDQRRRLWPFMLTCDGGHAFIVGGWKAVQEAQGLKQGDTFMLELVQNGKVPIFNLHFQGMKGNIRRPHMNAKNDVSIFDEGSTREEKDSTPKQQKEFSSHDEESDNHHFISTITPSSIKWSYLLLPAAFARSNGLSNRSCKLILRDPQERSWYIDLKPKGLHRAYIRRGLILNEFFTANGLKEGDSFKFELVENGETPIVNFLTHFTVDEESYNPHFVSTIKPSFTTGSYLYLPAAFARSNGLSNRRCELILKDSQERSWYIDLKPKGHHRAYIKRGLILNEFFTANGLKEGDSFKFELVKNGETPIVNFLTHFTVNPKPEPKQEPKPQTRSRPQPPSFDVSILDEGSSREEKESTPKQQNKFSSHDEEFDNHHFISTITPSSIKWSYLLLPAAFARSNGLSNRRCELILTDPQERSWYIDLRPKGIHRAYIRRGLILNEFFTANGLKEGDSFKFELVENGEKPIVNFLTHFTVDPEPKPEQEPEPWTQPRPQPPLDMKMNGEQKGKRVEASPESDDQPYFISTITPYSMSRGVLYLPMKFARSNGLVKKKGEMILRDEKQRLWPVRLEHKGGHLLISSGWQEFRKANGLKEGDSYKFELIKKGQRPVADFIASNAYKFKTRTFQE